MKAFIKANPLIAAAAVIAAIALFWVSMRGAKQTGIDIGVGAVELAGGIASGVGSSIYSAADSPETNPLYGFGSGIGEIVFNATH